MTDEVFFGKESNEVEMISNFVIPWRSENTTVEIDNNDIRLTSSEQSMRICASSIASIRVIEGETQSCEIEELAFVSTEMGSVTKSIRVELHWLARKDEQEINETFIIFN